MRKSAQRAVLAGLGLLAISIGVGPVGLVGRAHADDPPCVATATDSCPSLVHAPKPDAPRRPHWAHCQPAGPHGGAQCTLAP
jgi:hypothetical protein